MTRNAGKDPAVTDLPLILTAADYARLIVSYQGGAPVRLADLGRVIDSVQNDKNMNYYYDADNPDGTPTYFGQMLHFVYAPTPDAVDVPLPAWYSVVAGPPTSSAR